MITGLLVRRGGHPSVFLKRVFSACFPGGVPEANVPEDSVPQNRCCVCPTLPRPLVGDGRSRVGFGPFGSQPGGRGAIVGGTDWAPLGSVTEQTTKARAPSLRETIRDQRKKQINLPSLHTCGRSLLFPRLFQTQTSSSPRRDGGEFFLPWRSLCFRRRPNGAFRRRCEGRLSVLPKRRERLAPRCDGAS